MALEKCKLCEQDATPWMYIRGHICQDCAVTNGKSFCNETKSSWIKCDDKLPKSEEQVIGCCYGYVTQVRSNGQYFWDDARDCRVNVTHWMPLPEPPQK